jgi:hypothetical protein
MALRSGGRPKWHWESRRPSLRKRAFRDSQQRAVRVDFVLGSGRCGGLAGELRAAVRAVARRIARG